MLVGDNGVGGIVLVQDLHIEADIITHDLSCFFAVLLCEIHDVFCGLHEGTEDFRMLLFYAVHDI